MAGISKPRGEKGEGGNGSQIWVAVGNGMFTLPAKKDAPHAVQVRDSSGEPVLDKDKNPKYVTEHRDIEGRITKIDHRTAVLYKDEETTFMCVHMVADGQSYRIDVKETPKGRYWENLVKRLVAVDFNMDVKLAPYNFEVTDDDGKKSRKIGIAVYQDGTKVEAQKIEGLPDWEKVKDPTTGKMVNSNLAQHEYLRDVVLAKIIERLNSVTGEVAADGPGGHGMSEEDGDMPDEF